MKHFLLATTLIFSAPAAMACETVTIGDLTVEHAWSKATIGAGRPGVFYVEIKNSGTTDDALVGITTPAAGMPMLHETVVQDGIASMPHAMSVPVPAGQSVQLAPGGYHGMLMELTTALKAELEEASGKPVFALSAAGGTGVEAVLDALLERLTVQRIEDEGPAEPIEWSPV